MTGSSHTDRENSSEKSPATIRTRWRLAIAALCAIGAIILWLVPSNVAGLVAQQGPVLLGRYSVEKFTINLILTVVLGMVGRANIRPKNVTRQDWFKLITVITATAICLILVDGVWRMVRPVRYIETQVVVRDNWPRTEPAGVLRRRPPNKTYTITFVDEPETERSYPFSPQGFPPEEITLTIDASGYRNTTDLSDYDMVTLGDSFTEGSRVSDDQMWPVAVSKASGLSVYNLGISGTSPKTYLNAMLAHGLDKQPEIVLVTIYEGNDLRANQHLDFVPPSTESKSVSDKHASNILKRRRERITNSTQTNDDGSAHLSLKRYVTSSPLIAAAKRTIIRLLGGIRSDADFRGSEVFDWMPVRLSTPKATVYYAFGPDRLTGLLWDADRFRHTSGWLEVEHALRLLKSVCTDAHAEMIICFAPSKAHVVLPLVRDDLPADHMQIFASFEEGRGVPTVDTFLSTLFDRMDDKEEVVRDWCEDNDIGFLSFTEPLRQKMQEGVQVYYTYDQHWTRLGHEVVAAMVVEYLDNRNSNLENSE